MRIDPVGTILNDLLTSYISESYKVVRRCWFDLEKDRRHFNDANSTILGKIFDEFRTFHVSFTLHYDHLDLAALL